MEGKLNFNIGIYIIYIYEIIYKYNVDIIFFLNYFPTDPMCSVSLTEDMHFFVSLLFFFFFFNIIYLYFSIFILTTGQMTTCKEKGHSHSD